MARTHTTCYVDTFITVAPDTRALQAIDPPVTAIPSVAALTFQMISQAPYVHTSDDVIFKVWADRHGVSDGARGIAREEFFSQPRACLRSSDLGKKYGWGIHSNSDGRVALYGLGSAEYETLASGISPRTNLEVKLTTAMRSTRKPRP